MKAIKYILITLVAATLLASCEKETLGVSRVTIYCELELKGNSTEFVSLGQTYNEPGWVATENGVDVSKAVKVSGSVNTDKAGLYNLTYSVYNVDGFAKTSTRQVVVADATPTNLASGFYTVSAASNRNGTTVYGKEFTILIYQSEPGVFFVSDLLGGYYDQRAGYGPAYAMKGYIKLNSDNSLGLVSSFLDGWGDSLDGMVDASYDPATKTLKWTAKYAGQFNFNVIATKQ